MHVQELSRFLFFICYISGFREERRIDRTGWYTTRLTQATEDGIALVAGRLRRSSAGRRW
jgi:hypothetical protein